MHNVSIAALSIILRYWKIKFEKSAWLREDRNGEEDKIGEGD